MKWMFKEDHSLEHRCIESAKIRNKYPDRVPVIVEKVSGSQIVDIDKRKYLVPSDITVAQFMWIIRKRIQLPSEKAIFLFVDKTVPQSSLSELWKVGCCKDHERKCIRKHLNHNFKEQDVLYGSRLALGAEPLGTLQEPISHFRSGVLNT
ncbi:Gamma-aminobutyric acid receptor-associated protein-like 2 [Liparis tanakae]|uniref:Gamma-aminobutyric acid receptor-associated protein-like 2 n=1 Tax=Liparis tanakae TaxID=230148 RepID=A0A4Z2H143_9TELE|nr:Gamma-aminobutyric acid receptor-associated protein-like 2 [Liparis tanakae]